MTKTGEKIIVRDEILNRENFHRIEEFLLEHGMEVIWSNLYGSGMQFRSGDVSVIYSYLGFGGPPLPGPDGFRRPFFFMDVYPEGRPDEHSARCDALYTFDVKAPDEAAEAELHIQDMTLWYHNRKIAPDQVERNARHAFEVLLEAIDDIS